MFENLDAGGTKEKFSIIKELADGSNVYALCKLLKVSRSGYYAYLKRGETDRDESCKALIQAVYDRYEGKYGYRQIQLFLLQDHQVWWNHKKVLRLMQALELQAKIRRKRRYNYSSSVGGRFADNLLSRNFKADEPNQKWVTDVTQFRVLDTWVYLSAIKDLFNNEIVAYHMSLRNDNELVLQTFRNAFEKTKDVSGLIVHSDQGFQYTSYAYHDMLPQVGAQISMSRRGNCYDNASMESFFSHLKTEGLYPYDIRTLDEVQRRIETYIQFYNHNRPQRKLNKLTPVQYRRQLVA
ncbi:IS3 family transposase [Paenibacillus sp. D2_2]|uniref:IS3 family transposase n=1 Tax=Paenibacillus sp. D2_2 TaxID=3073092 RepID=UPI002814A774|nr:IS3 family transposase [Paenibacillus sp. D2_2]WMT38812.1 IS3 family transposase [Paenibacillus sp. D2_2]WMT39301.1 IS3 family transposase [Paenibacillus sp. D2_2]WMT40015.1 IS3 family transposase [Paenibacillus sp. D2_2]WMT41192.1 IS3 family transposase [Paenibacillus sp. D2_2]WMT42018.1 IS3 family transposase [Paenibacillus sp. D2_2]